MFTPEPQHNQQLPSASKSADIDDQQLEQKVF
jgi:hypothetical protein